jgi:putative transposase
MSRISRVVVPGVAHHITQRGCGRQVTFHSDEDRLVYVDLLRANCEEHRLRLWAWCLMSNHVHLLAVPEREASLARALGRAHAQYAQYWNARRRSCGHVWQARFFSCPIMEGEATWTVARYIENNPVRAGMVATAQAWRWSSAEAHVTGRDEFGLVELGPWAAEWGGPQGACALNHGTGDEAWEERLRAATVRGRPFGSEGFVAELESRCHRRLRPNRPGRPPKPTQSVEQQLVLSLGI